MKELLERYPQLGICKNSIAKAVEKIVKCYENGGKVLICGNGGSCADSDHVVGELMKGFLKKRPITWEKKSEMKSKCPELSDEVLCGLQEALPAISLCSLTALNTAFSNDVDPDMIYAQSVYGLGRESDVFIGISTSGNAVNVYLSACVARSLGMTVIGLTGKDGGKIKDVSDVCVIVPENETYKIQELHLPIYHYICAAVEGHFFSK